MKYIYCFTNTINNKKYIDSTIQLPNVRYNQHIYNAFHENVHQYHYPLYEAIRKYGLENFRYDILLEQDCDEQTIRDIEKKYIIQYNTLAPNGYNQTLDTQHPVNDVESYQKMSQTKRNNAKCVAEVDSNNNILHIWNSISDCAEELKINEKHIAGCCRGERHTVNNRIFYWLDNNNNLIIPTYTGTIYKGKPGTTQQQITNKKVCKCDKNTGDIITIYDSVALASRENNCDNSAIVKVCKGKRKTCGGFSWKYYDEENKKGKELYR